MLKYKYAELHKQRQGQALHETGLWKMGLKSGKQATEKT